MDRLRIVSKSSRWRQFMSSDDDF